jgi:hypothetical protein
VGVVSATIYHVRKTSVGIKRKYRISADDGAGRPGAVLGYAEKQLKVSDEIVIYRDEKRTECVAVVRESSVGFVAALTGYDVVDAAGKRRGSFGVLVKKSMDRTTWEFEQPSLGRVTGSERSLKTARLRRLISLGGGTAGEIAGAVMKYHFDFLRDGEPMFSIEKPKVLDDWYRVTVHDDRIDRTLLFALAVTMEARQRG